MRCNADGVYGGEIVIDHAGKQSLRAADVAAQKPPQHLGPILRAGSGNQSFCRLPAGSGRLELAGKELAQKLLYEDSDFFFRTSAAHPIRQRVQLGWPARDRGGFCAERGRELSLLPSPRSILSWPHGRKAPSA